MVLNMMEKKGFTLAEVVISVLLIVVALTGLFASVSQSAIFSNRIDRTYTATYLAQRRIDVLKRFDFSEIATKSGEETNVRIDADGNISPSGEYIRSTEITPDYDGNQYLLKIKVTVAPVRVDMDGHVMNGNGTDLEFSNGIVMETLISDVV